MNNATRRGRGRPPANAEPNMFALSRIDCLILAQAVWELGADSWPAVAEVLAKHPLLSHPKSFFTPKSCQSMYSRLMTDAELEITVECDKEHASANLALAKKHYEERLEELRELVGAEEAKFKKLVLEIEQIRNGDWDGLQTSRDSTVRIGATATEVEAEAGVKLKDSQRPQAGSTPTSPKADVSRAPAETQTNSEKEGLLPSTTAEVEVLSSLKDGRAEEERVVELKEGSPLTDEPVEEQEQETRVVDTSEKRPPLSPADASDIGSTGFSLKAEGKERPPPLHLPTMDIDVQEQQTEDNAQTTEAVIDGEILTTDGSGDETDSSADEPLHAKRRSTRKSSSSKSTKDAKTRRQGHEAESEIPTEADDKTGPDGEEPLSPTPELPLTQRRTSKRKSSVFEDTVQEKKRARTEPAEDEDIGTPVGTTRRRRNDDSAGKRFQTVITLLHNQISQHRNGNIFLNPIKKSDAPDYREIVKRPMDLKTIRARIKDGTISNSMEYQRDIYLMFANAMMYNKPGTDIYTMAEEMMMESEAEIHTHRSQTLD